MAEKVRGRRPRRLRFLLITAGTLATIPSGALAGDLYWDPNGAAVGQGGNGPWDTTSPIWQDPVTLTFMPWSNASPTQPFFSGAGGTVTLAEPITATAGMIFGASGPYQVGGGTLTVAGNITNNSDATISSSLAGSAAITKLGASGLTLAGDNSSWSGSLIVSSGTVVVAHSQALGGTAAGVSVPNDLATLELAPGVSTPAGENIVWNSRGVGQLGGVRSQSGNTTWGGTVQPGPGPNTARIGVDAGTMTLAGGLVGTSGFEKVGGGTLAVTGGTSSFSGFVFVAEGALSVRHPDALGGSSSTANTIVNPNNAARIEVQHATGMSIGERLTISGTAGYGALRNTGGDNTWSGQVMLSFHTRLTADSGRLALSNVTYSGSTAPKLIISPGAGRIALTNGNNFYGAVEVEGELEVNGPSFLGDANYGTTVKPGGTLRLVDAYVSGEALTLGAAGAGVVTVRSQAPTQGASYWSNGSWTMLNDVVVNIDGPSLRRLVLNVPVNANGHTLTKRGGGRLILNNVANNIPTAVIEEGQLMPSNGGAAGTNVVISPTSVSATLIMEDAQTVASLSAAPPAPGRSATVSLSGGPLTVNQSIDTTFAGALTSWGQLVKAGAGALTLTGPALHDGGFAINGGVLAMNGANYTGFQGFSLGGGGTLRATASFTMVPHSAGRETITVNASGGTLDTNGFAVGFGNVDGAGTFTKAGAGSLSVTHVRTGALSVTGGRLTIIGAGDAATSTAGSLSVTGGGQIDLRDVTLITNSPAGSASGGVYDGVQGLVQAGHHGGAWDGTSAIITSMPDAAGGLTSLGVATGAQVRGLGLSDTDTFAGQTISGASTIAMYTYAGDANLDGFISGDDYAAIDLNVAVSGASGWFNGDFNYDGIISGDDYATIDLNIVAQGAPFPTSGSVGVSGVTTAPEPGGMAMALGVASWLVGGGRRRRR